MRVEVPEGRDFIRSDDMRAAVIHAKQLFQVHEVIMAHGSDKLDRLLA